MHVTRLGNRSSFGGLNFTDMDAYHAVNNHLGATGVSLIPMDMVLRVLKHWRDYRRDGMSKTWILGEMQRQRIALTSGAYILSDAQILGLVTALDRLEKGDVPVNPWNSPSWSEAWQDGPGKIFNSGSAVALALIVGGAIVLHGFAGGMGRR